MGIRYRAAVNTMVNSLYRKCVKKGVSSMFLKDFPVRE